MDRGAWWATVHGVTKSGYDWATNTKSNGLRLLLCCEEQEEKGTTRWLDGITDFMNMSLSKLREMVKDREAWCPSVHGVTKSWTWLSNWTELLWGIWIVPIRLGRECSVGYCKYAEVSCSGYVYFLQLWLFPCDEFLEWRSWIKRHRPSKQCLKGSRSIGRTLTDTLPGTGQCGL